MKTIKSLFVYVSIAALSVNAVMAQGTATEDSTGLPGDHFSLQGALQLFEKAGSPEEFESLINKEDNNVNNLDLNGDGQVDYVRVIDKMENDVHVLILQVPVSATESQDIAVIEIEKNGAASALLQIIGDEDIYGEQVIVEPDGGGADDAAFMDEFNSSNRGGPNAKNVFSNNRIIVNVWLWPSVRFMFRPVYAPWVSPWRWNHYPSVWRPWRPYGWYAWKPRRHIYYGRPFVVVQTHRVVRAHSIYKPIRVVSVSCRSRHAVAMNHYKVTRTKTTVTGPRGNTGVRKTTTVSGPRGHVKARKTTIRRRG